MKYPLFFLFLATTIFSAGFATALGSEEAQATFAVH